MSTALLRTRPAEAYDLPDIVRIEQGAFADPWSAESFGNALALERMRFLVAEETTDVDSAPEAGDFALLGYVIALVVSDEAEIANLAVAPHARRRGVGGLLLDRTAELLAQQGVRWLYLEVRESNAGARALYESRSFVQVGRRSGYYRRPVEDALLLKRDLVPT